MEKEGRGMQKVTLGLPGASAVGLPEACPWECRKESLLEQADNVTHGSGASTSKKSSLGNKEKTSRN